MLVGPRRMEPRTHTRNKSTSVVTVASKLSEEMSKRPRVKLQLDENKV
jgi:hypothetical protein